MPVGGPTPVVVGAGMAGLMLAATLGRARRQSVVLEQAGALDEVGAGVQLTPRSVRLLQQVGATGLLDSAVVIDSREVRSWRGGLIARSALGASCTERYGAPYLTLHRADLHRALLLAAPDDAVRLSSRAVRVEPGEGSARVVLDDGTAVEGALVVGADGIRSRVRATLRRDDPVPSGLAAYRALVPTSSLPAAAAEPVVRIWVGAGSHAVTYPVRGGELVNVVAVVPSPAVVAEAWTAPARVDDLLPAFLGWDPLLVEILSRVTTTTAWALHDRAVLPGLAQGRVVLVGDAAHPMLPFAAQGVNQALEDSWVLAACLLASGPAGITDRLLTYSRLRAPRAAQAQVDSRHLVATLHVPDGPARAARDADVVAGGTLRAQDALLAPRGWHAPAGAR